MGGYGSGRHGWASPKETVESCLVLSAAWLQSEGRIEAGLYGGGGLVWRNVSTGEKTASIGYHVNTSAGERPTIRLQYTLTRRGEEQGEDLDYKVRLTTTPLPWGGVRWWFVCGCGRRVGKLYLPPRELYFACRHCYDLTYESTRDNLAKRVARLTGFPASSWKAWAKLCQRAIGRESRRPV